MSDVELSGVLVSKFVTTSEVGRPGALNDGKAGRRTFLKGLGTLGAALSGGTLAPTASHAQAGREINKGDAALLRFAAAAEIIESDIWLQYAELGGVQDSDEVFLLASKLIPGYPAKATGGNPKYTKGLQFLDWRHAAVHQRQHRRRAESRVFLNTYLDFKGAAMVNLDKFRTLRGSQATGANKNFGRLTNLTQLTVDTTWWTRYRSRTKNPDLAIPSLQRIPTLATGKHTAIPRTDSDTPTTISPRPSQIPPGFHFAWIEQGGTSLYPQVRSACAQSRSLAHIAKHRRHRDLSLSDVARQGGQRQGPVQCDRPSDRGEVTFPDLNTPPDEDLQTNLIMPEPTVFLSRQFPPCSIIRPTETRGAAMAAVTALTDDGLFIGQSSEFIALLKHLAAEADEARREDD